MSKEASMRFFKSETQIEQRGCFYIYKKWDQPERPMGRFYSDMRVEIYNFDDYLNYPLNKTNALLHELSHAEHALVGLDNVDIAQNYARVNKSRIYFNVKASNGVTVPKTYGMMNARELFASLSVPFLGGYNDYFPMTHSQLQEYDPESVAILRKIWRMKHLIQVDRHGFTRQGHLKPYKTAEKDDELWTNFIIINPRLNR